MSVYKPHIYVKQNWERWHKASDNVFIVKHGYKHRQTEQLLQDYNNKVKYTRKYSTKKVSLQCSG